MLNIYSNSFYAKSGPGKLLINLKKGLNICKINYSVNSILPIGKIYCQDNHRMLFSNKISEIIIGPNICVLPNEHEIIMRQKFKKIITPCKWVCDTYTKYIDIRKIEILPIGIDYILFDDFSKLDKSNDCLVYFKNRSEKELVYIIDKLKKYSQSYVILRYGNYDEAEFLNLLKISRYSIVLDNTESQGIAIEEMMSTNLPLFVCDQKKWYYKDIIHPATSIPYWSNICGEVIDDWKLFDSKFEYFIKNISQYNPREFILKELKLEDKAKHLYDLF